MLERLWITITSHPIPSHPIPSHPFFLLYDLELGDNHHAYYIGLLI
jgi:hypothetical protein